MKQNSKKEEILCHTIMEQLEELAPCHYAEEWDNVGLLVGRKSKKVEKIMVALDATKQVIQQAIEQKVDMLITHHPMIFSSMKKITDEEFLGEKVVQLIQNDISYYAMHTNCDIMVMNEKAADFIELKNRKILMPIKENEKTGKTEGIGTYGSLEQEITLSQLAEKVKGAFSLDEVRVVGDKKTLVKTVAISTGAGKSMIRYALKAAVSVLITGDMDHHSALDAKDQGLSIIDAGHFGTEHFMKECIKTYIEDSFQRKINVVVALETNPFTIM